MSVAEAADRFQRRHRWLGVPVAVLHKYVDDEGATLAGLLAYHGLLALFPGFLLLVSVVGFVLDGDVDAQRRVINSAVAQLPVVGDHIAENVRALRGSSLGIAVAVLLLLVTVLGVGHVGQLVFNRVWAVPRRERPKPWMSRMLDLVFVFLLLGGLAATTVLTGVASATQALDSHVAIPVRVLLALVAAVANVVLFAVGFRLLTARVVAMRDLVPGAVIAAIGWDLLQSVGATYLSYVVGRKTNFYGASGVVLGLLAWLYLGAVITVIAAETNVVLACRLWPRSLLGGVGDGRDRRHTLAGSSYAEMRRKELMSGNPGLPADRD